MASIMLAMVVVPRRWRLSDLWPRLMMMMMVIQIAHSHPFYTDTLTILLGPSHFNLKTLLSQGRYLNLVFKCMLCVCECVCCCSKDLPINWLTINEEIKQRPRPSSVLQNQAKFFFSQEKRRKDWMMMRFCRWTWEINSSSFSLFFTVWVCAS